MRGVLDQKSEGAIFPKRSSLKEREAFHATSQPLQSAMSEVAGKTLLSKVVGRLERHIVVWIFWAEMIIQEETVATG